jgi:hypothetical protein
MLTGAGVFLRTAERKRGFYWCENGQVGVIRGGTEVESEAVATPIIKGTLVIESEETA